MDSKESKEIKIRIQRDPKGSKGIRKNLERSGEIEMNLMKSKEIRRDSKESKEIQIGIQRNSKGSKGI
jgi:hypothetical protein